MRLKIQNLRKCRLLSSFVCRTFVTSAAQWLDNHIKIHFAVIVRQLLTRVDFFLGVNKNVFFIGVEFRDTIWLATVVDITRDIGSPFTVDGPVIV